ncbi:hypothetical protein WJX72_001979 [[Myrmecia] bisecta]|uniref:Plastid lipid-associated protein/fibrillin conserved domain-containing protein n=1 Tax=[Myrmecia] bisecta TaxID=41462 RepID=A0AAW1Q6L3_9CHLO
MAAFTCPAGQVTTRAGLFDIFTKPAIPTADPRVEELVDSLLDAVRNTDGGAKASAQKREQIGELVEELSGSCIRAPTRSPLFWGEYTVAYCSNPNAPGGPVLRSGPGRALLTNQRLTQTLTAPNSLLNSVSFKTAGLFPGTANQEGTVKIVDGNRYRVTLQSPSIKLAGGKGGDAADENGVERLFEVVYLDSRIRVVRFLPTQEQGDPSVFVFQRTAAQADEEEEEEEVYEEEEEEEEEESNGSKRGGGFDLGSLFAKPPPSSMATIAERNYGQAKDAAKQQAGTVRAKVRQAAGAQPQEGTARAGGRKAAAAASNGAGKGKEAAQRAAVQKRLQELTAAAREAQEEAKQSGKALRDFERSSAGPLRQAEQARAVIARYASETESAQQQAEMAAEAEKKAAQQFKEAAANLRELQKSLR